MRYWIRAVAVLTLSLAAAGCGGNGNSPAGPGDAGSSYDSGTDGTLPPDGSSCVPKTCAELGVNCGPQSDGCGKVIDCGTCTAPDFCGGGGPSRCGAGSCVKLTCAKLGASCGQQADGCGGVIDCGTCTAPETCGGGGTPNACGQGSQCVPKTCSDFPAGTCGQQPDGCGGLTANCGTCTAPKTCGGGGTPNVCGTSCVKKTCSGLGYDCGQVGDGCGGLLNCGTCASPETCGGGGTPNVCGTSCVPKTCSDFPAGTCGQQPDGCGGLTASCGTCSTSDIIASSRRADWSKAGVEGGIPNRTTVCATLSPGASASQINSAIASCSNSGGGVVSLKAGTYNLSGGVDFAGHNNVTVRGAGADQTFLVFSAGVGCDGPTADVCFRPTSLSWPGGPQNTANWTSGYSQGTTQIGLSSVSNLKAGSMLILDQLDDSTDTGNVLDCEAIGSLCSTEGPGGGERSNRAEQQIVTVTAVSGSTVTISPGLRMPNWRSSEQPGAWWGNATVSGDGLEDLSLDHTNSDDKSGIDLTEATNCWIKGVRSIGANRNHVWFYEATHDTIVDNYFYGTKNAVSQSYGVESFMGSDNLVENNIFQHITGPLMNNGGAGTVEAYNYVTDDFYQTSGWMMGAIWLHAAGSDMYLFEGNEGPAFTADDIHGTHNMVTLFRNRLLGWDPGRWGNSPTSSYSQTTPIMLYTHSRYFNVIGNVLGWPGYHTNYEDAAPSGTNSNHSVFTLGWGGNTGTNGSVANDALTISSLMRWGNYDTATGAVRWNASEVPSGLSKYGNPVPADHKLPTSLFLSAPPSWWTTPWGTPAWPAIGPDVTGGPGPGGHSYDIPAKLCYAHTAKDSSGILKFSAASCYGK